jgi:hypothetical protein
MVRKPMSWKETGLLFLGLTVVYFGDDIFFGPASLHPPASMHWQHVWLFVRRAAIVTASLAMMQRAAYGWKVWNWKREQNRANLESPQNL